MQGDDAVTRRTEMLAAMTSVTSTREEVTTASAVYDTIMNEA